MPTFIFLFLLTLIYLHSNTASNFVGSEMAHDKVGSWWWLPCSHLRLRFFLWDRCLDVSRWRLYVCPWSTDRLMLRAVPVHSWALIFLSSSLLWGGLAIWDDHWLFFLQGCISVVPHIARRISTTMIYLGNGLSIQDISCPQYIEHWWCKSVLLISYLLWKAFRFCIILVICKVG